jgi:hypothetical protein
MLETESDRKKALARELAGLDDVARVSSLDTARVTKLLRAGAADRASRRLDRCSGRSWSGGYPARGSPRARGAATGSRAPARMGDFWPGSPPLLVVVTPGGSEAWCGFELVGEAVA